ncbi:MAG: putative cell wall-binding protein, partial [Glaciecola sp.]
ATVVGGPGAVSTAVLQDIRTLVGSANRIAGNSRYETSYQVALVARDAGMSVTSMWLATGENFPDALAAGAAVAKEGGIMLLVHGSNYASSPRVSDWLYSLRNEIESVTIAGGTGAVSASVEARVRQDTAT